MFLPIFSVSLSSIAMLLTRDTTCLHLKYEQCHIKLSKLVYYHPELKDL